RLGAAADPIVLIGGQALNFWAERFAGRATALENERPFASRDICCGTQESVRLCARALGGRAEWPTRVASASALSTTSTCSARSAISTFRGYRAAHAGRARRPTGSRGRNT